MVTAIRSGCGARVEVQIRNEADTSKAFLESGILGIDISQGILRDVDVFRINFGTLRKEVRDSLFHFYMGR
ncbi:hypothetical protein KC358_g8 [Hortaea werneckii]|nr:hypothetical protein KC358_g8 [Hortaea werneckii]